MSGYRQVVGTGWRRTQRSALFRVVKVCVCFKAPSGAQGAPPRLEVLLLRGVA